MVCKLVLNQQSVRKIYYRSVEWAQHTNIWSQLAFRYSVNYACVCVCIEDWGGGGNRDAVLRLVPGLTPGKSPCLPSIVRIFAQHRYDFDLWPGTHCLQGTSVGILSDVVSSLCKQWLLKIGYYGVTEGAVWCGVRVSVPTTQPRNYLHSEIQPYAKCMGTCYTIIREHYTPQDDCIHTATQCTTCIL